LRMARAKDSILKKKMMALAKQQSLIKIRFRSEEDYHASSDSGFAALGPIAKPAVPALIDLLKHQDAKIRATAALDLMWIGPEAQEAVPALVNCLDDQDMCVRFSATRCLRDIHMRPDLAVPALIRSLNASKVPKTETIAALLQFGPQAKAATPSICRSLQDRDWQARCAAIYALERIEADPASVIPALIAALNDANPVVRSSLTNALLRLDPVAAASAGVNTNAPGL